MKKLFLLTILIGCDSQGLSLARNVPDSGADTLQQYDTVSQHNAECQIATIGQIHSWIAIIRIPEPGIQPGIDVYLDGHWLTPDKDYYFVPGGPGVNPPGDYVYIRSRDAGDHDVGVTYGCKEH